MLFILTMFTTNVTGQNANIAKSTDQFLLKSEKGTALERRIVSDSIEYELRVWFGDTFLPSKVFQITKDFKDNWDYRLGYFKYGKSHKFFEYQDSLKKEIY